ncbi:MAG: S24/S26 family peptidase [Clostridia bacterium]|nr:S24/S26 family peptidase [Clostridia bacterium]
MTQDTKTRSIPMEQWCDMAREGAAPPVTICLEGESMRPLIRRGKDPVTIVPLTRSLMKGDVVLFRLGERYVVHRVWRLQEGLVQTFGDNCWNPEPWFPVQQVLGQVVKYSRNGRIRRLDTPVARAWGRLWMAIHPIRKCYKRLRALAGRCYRKVFPKR